MTAAEPDPAMRRQLTAKAAAARVPVEVTSDPAVPSQPFLEVVATPRT